jgi:hypothetical protein
MDELKLSKTLRHHTDAVSATALLHGLPISAGKDGYVCVWDAAAPNSPLVVLEAGGPVHALQLQEEKGEWGVSGLQHALLARSAFRDEWGATRVQQLLCWLVLLVGVSGV